MAVDPVCGRSVDPEAVDRPTGTVRGGAVEVGTEAGTKAFLDGQWVYYCGLDCRRQHAAEQPS